MMNAMEQKRLQLVISDIGDVYIVWHGVIERICETYGLPKKEFTDWYLRDFATMLYEGILPVDEFWKTVENTYHVHVQGDPFTTFFDGKSIVGMERLFKNLKKHGVRIVSASNTYASNWDVCLRNAGMSVFAAHYPSHILHLSKPSPSYYQFIMEHENASPQACLFIDDREENIEGAEAVGIPSYRYVYTEDKDVSLLGAYIHRTYGIDGITF